MADITDKFSFAYLKEAFVSTLLELARDHADSTGEESYDDDEENDPLEKYEFWRAFKAQVAVLRGDMDSEVGGRLASHARVAVGGYEGISGGAGDMAPLLQNMRLQGGVRPPGKAAPSRGVDPTRVTQHDDAPDLSFVHSFAPLARNKRATLEADAQVWGGMM